MATFEEELQRHAYVPDKDKDPQGAEPDKTDVTPPADAGKGTPPAEIPATPPVTDKLTEEPKGDIDQERVLGFLDQNEPVVYDYLSKKFGKEIKSLEDLIETKEIEKDIELPEDVKTFMDFKKETGRGFDDFMKLKKDWKAESKDAVVMEYIRQKEGLDGEMLAEYFELNFKPDEDEATDKEKRMARLNFEKSYKQALDHFEQQKSQYRTPSQDQTSKRQAEDEARLSAERFEQGVRSAVKDFKAIKVDDFSFGIQEPEKIASKFSSVEKLMDSFKVNGQFDYSKFVSTLVAGENAQSLAKAYAEHFHNKQVEAELAKLSNRQTGNPAPAPGGNISPEEAVRIFKQNF